ncbi:PTS fructose transporter subunit IIABC [Pectinatus cerevisiiphilus]|uniref:PTS system fructose-specific IIC component n=1 Tax=Pectinatus cerevisiiphilus TaxID=86956 RepID=A0A4R3K364_9FIRM|nr:PTS fructose transporter subunit IIABC [Pectinatus cerevisiiphilus]TCS77145.1 PTS system fructose-specific IIC component [Pectinatus cerevisiiphilus]
MHITDLLKKESILLDAHPVDKKDAINMLVDLMDNAGVLTDKEMYKKAVFLREESGTTGLGDGIATPHAKSPAVKKAALAAMVVKDGVDFASMDNRPARLFFLIAAPDSANDEHLQMLSALATMLMDSDFKESLIAAKSVEQFLELINKKEATRSAATAEEQDVPQKKADQYEILAVTACPTGIAHTYMAAESLEQHAKKRNISIKVETEGSGGTKNELTSKEIADAKCIIVAADKNVPMARFNGRPVLITKVANGINKADELLDKALGGEVPIYKHDATNDEGSVEDEPETFGRQVYKHLMNGVSHMLPFVVGGGILIAIAFLVDPFDPANPANFGSNTPLAAFFKNVGGVSFGFMLPVLAGFIAMSIADRPGLVAGFVGGAMANSGGSGFLGALLAGFVAGYVIIGLRKVCSVLPHSLEGIKTILIYPLFGVLLMGLIITFIINPPVSGINTWLIETLKNMDTNSRVLIGAILGGMMSVDMGGPVNKAAYVIGTGMLASGEYGIMAAVMAGGMVPPLAIALCSTFFKNRFTDNERKSAVSNYVMGLSFITEGAIPFAASDPLRVIPSCIVGSAAAGALSMAFNCTLRAPHGGIFVVPTIGNPVMYLVAIIIGSLVSMAILAVLKKPLK